MIDIHQAYSKLMTTCSMFAMYSSALTKSVNQVVNAVDTVDREQAMYKCWDVLKKFETNFNHWWAEYCTYCHS